MPGITPIATTKSIVRYGRFLIFVAGLGGLLYGIDVGIIAAALLYLNKTINLSLEQTSFIVAAVLGGGMCSSLVGGMLADWLGRKKMMIISGLLFVASVGLIVISQGFVPLFLGRLLQGLSGGVIAVVVPLILAAENHAWRGMFLSIVYPGLIFFVGSFFLSETPRWLFRHGRPEDALTALRRSSSEEEAQRQFHEMQALALENERVAGTHGTGSLLQRKYIVPFILACVILSCNQTTGINSVLAFLVIILK